jgi:hypothetical protein
MRRIAQYEGLDRAGSRTHPEGDLMTEDFSKACMNLMQDLNVQQRVPRLYYIHGNCSTDCDCGGTQSDDVWFEMASQGTAFQEAVLAWTFAASQGMTLPCGAAIFWPEDGEAALVSAMAGDVVFTVSPDFPKPLAVALGEFAISVAA